MGNNDGSRGAGRAAQDAIYRPGTLGLTPRVPTDPDALERRARRAMSRRAWAYVAGGAGTGATVDANRAAFDLWQVVPRVLHGTDRRDLSTTVLGTDLAAPLMLAPVGAAALVAPDADVRIAEGAHTAGIPYVFSSQGGCPMEQTASAMAGTPFWYQLYWSSDEDLVDSMIGRAEAIGAQALVVTLDTTMLGWRTQDLDLGSLPFARGQGIAQYTSDPRFMQLVRERLADTARAAQSLGIDPRKPLQAARAAKGGVGTLLSMSREHPGGVRDNLRSPEPRAAVETFLDIYSNPALSWEHLATLRERTRLPIVLKGVLHEDDARRVLTLVGDDEADTSAGQVGWNAPIARALRGAAVGDLRRVALPAAWTHLGRQPAPAERSRHPPSRSAATSRAPPPCRGEGAA